MKFASIIAPNLSHLGGYDTYTHPPKGPATRRRLMAQFRREGEQLVQINATLAFG